jgi:superfamily II DNA or RNA helicase
VSALLSLRDYQRGALDAVADKWSTGVQRPAVVLPTGAGKTVVFAHGAAEFIAANPGRRVVILVHTDELVGQAVRKLRDVAPHLKVGIVKATRNEIYAEVIVASVQSLRSERRRKAIRNVGLVIVDECHHAVAATYLNALESFGCFDPSSGAHALGVTATLARGDNRKLSKVWQEVAYRKDILFMIKRGFLLDVRGKRVEVPDLDLKGVKQSGGDYQRGDLGDALEGSLAPETVAKAYAEHSSDRTGILFAPTVSSAYAFRDALCEAGITSETVHGGLAIGERQQILKRLEHGDIQCVTNCMVLTEGFDSPVVSTVVVARPTRSAPLYQQMVGRALRPYPGQAVALVLDVSGASRAHTLASLVDLSDEDLRINEDQSLLEAALEEEEQTEPAPEREELVFRGPVEVKDFDPLARASKRVWLTTAGGTRFISAGDQAYVFLIDSAETPGTYDVAWCTKDRYDRRGGITEHVGIDLGYALPWAEEEAVERGGMETETYSRKDRAWRKTAVTDNQKNMMRRLGIAPAPSEDPFTNEWEGMTAGDASMAIDTAIASARIDPIVTAIAAQRSATQ